MAVLAAAAVPVANAWGFDSHTVNNKNKFFAGTLQMEATTSGTVNCYSTGTGTGGKVGTNVTQCSGAAMPTGELTTSTVLSASSTITSIGTSAPTAATIAQLSCGVGEVADSSSSANTGLVYGGVSYGTAFASPLHSGFTSSGISFSGSDGTYVGTTASLTSPSTFTLAGWVQTSSTSGEGLIGFSNDQPDTGSTSQDRMLWVEPSGVVAFGVQNGTTEAEDVSTATVNDGAWHFVAASFSSAGLSLDVDGSSVTSTAISSATSYAGYWHLGWAGDSGWTNAGSTEYLNGSLFGWAVFPTVLSANKLSNLYNASGLSSYKSIINGASPTAEWLLSDTGTTAYTGTIPVLGTNQICSQILTDIEDTQNSTTTCLYPAGAGACPSTPPSSALLSSFTSSSVPLASSAPFSVQIQMLLGTPSVAGVIGLHLLSDFAFSISLSSWTAETAYLSSGLEL